MSFKKNSSSSSFPSSIMLNVVWRHSRSLLWHLISFNNSTQLCNQWFGFQQKLQLPSCLVISPLWLFFSCWFLTLPNFVLRKNVLFSVLFPLNSFLASSCKSIPTRSLKVGNSNQYNKMFDKDSILFGREFNIYSTGSFSRTTFPMLTNWLMMSFNYFIKLITNFLSFNQKLVSLVLRCWLLTLFCCSNKFFKVCHIIAKSKIPTMCGTISLFTNRLMIINALLFRHSRSTTDSPSFTLKMLLTFGSIKSINSSIYSKMVTWNVNVL